MKLVLLLVCSASILFAQAPPITGVGHDAVTTTTARIHWTAGFYHDTASDTKLTVGFTTVFAPMNITVASTAGWHGWNDSPSHIPTTFIMGGEWGRVVQVLSSTTATVEMSYTGLFGASDTGEAFYQTRSGLKIVVTGCPNSCLGTATLNYPMPSYWVAKHRFMIHYARTPNLWNDNYTIASVLSSTQFTFIPSGVPNGTYDRTTEPDIWLESAPGTVHVAGETISLLGTDNMVCYGDPKAKGKTYPHFTNWREDGTMGYPHAAQSSKHYAYITAQTPGSRVHYIVLSTPYQFGPSNCSSIGPHTGKSGDQYIDFPSTEPSTPTPPTGVTFSTALPGSYTDSVTVGVQCPDLQSCLNKARSTSGNHEIRITKGTTLTAPLGGYVLPPQSGGSLVTTIRSSAADTDLPLPGSCLPPLDPATATSANSPCIDNPAYSAQLAAIQTGNSSNPDPVFSVAPWTKADGIHLGPGLKIQANPHFSFAGQTALVNLSHYLGGGDYDHASHSSNVIVDRVYFYQKNIQNGALGAVYIQGGNSNAVVDSVVEGVCNRGQDFGGISIEGEDTSDGGYVIKNNRIEACSMPFYLGDAGWNTANGVLQRNWLHFNRSWDKQNREYTKQVQLSVASAATGYPTNITLNDPAEFNFGFDPLYINFSGASGNWAGLNAREFRLIDDTLSDFNCDGSRCTASTASPHGLISGQYIWVSNVALYPCAAEAGPHQVQVLDSTHLQYLSGTNAHCTYPSVSVLGPVFLPAASSQTSFTIAFDSSGLGALTGAVTASYGARTNTKNTGECKTCRYWDISGNIFENSIGHEQNAAGFSLTNRIAGAWQDISNFASTSTVSDINFHDNWFRSIGAWMPFLGIQDNGSVIPMTKITVRNTLVTDSSPLQCLPGENCYLNALTLSYGTHMVFDHNTELCPQGITGAALSTPPAYGDLTFTNSVVQFGGNGFSGAGDINGINHSGAQLYQTSGTCNGHPCAVANPPYPNSLTWGQNALIGEDCLSATGCRGGDPWGYQKQYYDNYTAGIMATDYQGEYWPRYDGGVGFAGATPITGASSASPVVLTTLPMSCIPSAGDRVRVSGVQGNTAANGNWVVKAAGSTFLTLLASAGDGIYTSGGTVIPLTGACNFSSNWSLGPSSPYRAGVTRVAPTTDLSTAGQGPALDGTDVGVNISALNSAIGVAAGRFSGAASDCSFTIDTGSAHHSTAGGSTMLYVIASAPSCKWSIGNAPDWITFSPTAGIGTGRVMAKVSPNPGGLRRASLLIGGQPFSVSQDAP